jgi:hypothetical protein
MSALVGILFAVLTWVLPAFPVGFWGNSYDKVILRDNPAVYLPLNEAAGNTAFDETGTFTGGNAFTYSSSCGSPTCFLFAQSCQPLLQQCATMHNTGQGSSKARVVTASSSLNFERTQAFSLEGWFKSTGVTTGGPLWTNIQGSLYQGYEIMMGVGASSKIAQWYIGHVFGSNGLQVNFTTSASHLDGNWHHAVLTYDGSSTPSGCKFYYDNSSITGSTVANNLTLTAVGTQLQAGQRVADNITFSAGTQLAGLAIYKYVLTSTQVDAHYKAGTIW